MLVAVERKVTRDVNAWRCPDGCAPNDNSCARLTTRRSLMPMRRSNTVWVEANDVRFGGRSCEISWKRQREALRELLTMKLRTASTTRCVPTFSLCGMALSSPNISGSRG